jgi:tetraacyldisaccharide 4'-kinase
MKFFKPKFWDRNKISFFSILLFPITLLIKLLSFVKKITTRTRKFSIPIICVGNVYLGGTGKTPLCIEIFIILKNLNKNPVFIRKKYSSFQDETNLQKQVGPLYESKKRIDALNKAIYNKADIAILDDGFQDFSIKKDLSIVCFNEKQWIGNGLVIPSGPLREDLSALNRANWVVIMEKKYKY